VADQRSDEQALVVAAIEALGIALIAAVLVLRK